MPRLDVAIVILEREKKKKKKRSTWECFIKVANCQRKMLEPVLLCESESKLSRECNVTYFFLVDILRAILIF